MNRAMTALPALANGLKGWANAALALVYPEVCQLCGERRATPGEGFVCGDCRGEARFIEPPFCERCGRPFQGNLTAPFECSDCLETGWAFTRARSAVVAKDRVLDAIHRYKYGRALWLEPFLAGLFIERASPALAGESWDALVPVPLHAARQRQREFNQAERLARRLSRATGIPVKSRWLFRRAATRTQTLLSRSERLANVRTAFAMRPGARVAGGRLVVVDDVMTTGATTGACAATLLAAGAAEVCVWTVARGI